MTWGRNLLTLWLVRPGFTPALKRSRVHSIVVWDHPYKVDLWAVDLSAPEFEASSTGLNKAGVNTTSDWSTFCCHYKHKVKKNKKCWGLVKFMLPISTETQRLFSLGNLCFYCTLFCRQHPSSFVTKCKSNIRSPSLSSYQVYSWYNCIHLTRITTSHTSSVSIPSMSVQTESAWSHEATMTAWSSISAT